MPKKINKTPTERYIVTDEFNGEPLFVAHLTEDEYLLLDDFVAQLSCYADDLKVSIIKDEPDRLADWEPIRC